MNTRRWTALLAVTATVLTSCRAGGGASPEDYNEARDAFNESLTESIGSPVNVDITDGEIDCLAEAVDEPVADLDEDIRVDDEAADDMVATVFRCLNSDSIRSMFDQVLGSEEEAEAAGYDRDCLLDTIVDAFDEWQKSDGGEEELLDALGEAGADQACMLNT